MAPRLVNLIAAVVFFGACFCSLATADTDSDFEFRREEERRNYQSMLSNMRVSLSCQSVSEVISLTTNRKSILLRTTLGPMKDFAKLKVIDRGISGVVHSTGGQAGTLSVPTALQFDVTDYSQPLQITSLSISAHTSVCNIRRSTQMPGGAFRHVALLQRHLGDFEFGAFVQVSVNSSEKDGTNRVNLVIQAPDFVTLIRRNPVETERYIRPLLRDFGMESVFAPEPLVAWQVFSGLWKVDAAIAQRVDRLLPQLDDDDWHSRLSAERQLEQLGRPAAAVILRLPRSRLTPEQNSRIDVVMSPYWQLTPKQAVAFHSDTEFLIDCLYSDDAEIRSAALNRLRELRDAALSLDLNAPLVQRNVAIDAIRQRLTGKPTLTTRPSTSPATVPATAP